jgi:hypothetical protein
MRLFLLLTCALLQFFSATGSASAATPVSLTIHGPSKVYESVATDFRAVVNYSDGTTQRAWAANWVSSSLTDLPFILQASSAVTRISGYGYTITVLPQPVNSNISATLSTSMTVNGVTLSASKSVQVLDASAYPTQTLTLKTGWNLLGNGVAAPISVNDVFGNAVMPVSGMSSAITSVWKWDAVNHRWSFFAPSMSPANLISYAASKGYNVLNVIHPGEGFWVNASQPVSLPALTAAPISFSSNGLINGWNLVSMGQQMTPSDFSAQVSETPPATNEVPQGYISLWAWDTDTNNWFFHAPSLEASGGLAAVKKYADSKNYLDFASRGKALSLGTGFWVNAASSNPVSNLAPLAQAKAMVNELRSTLRSYSNSRRNGFLDLQKVRISEDMKSTIMPSLTRFGDNFDLLLRATDFFETLWRGNFVFNQPVNGETYRIATYSETFPSFISQGNSRVLLTVQWFNGEYSKTLYCFSNEMTGTVFSKNLLTEVSCRVQDITTIVYGSTTKNETFTMVRVSPQNSMTLPSNSSSVPDELTYKWDTFRVKRVDPISLPSAIVTVTTPVGSSFSGAFSRSYLAGTRNVSNFNIAGDMLDMPDLDHSAVNLTGTRSLLDATNSIYRNTFTGSIVGKNAAGASMAKLSLGTGSYLDVVEDSQGNLANTKFARGLKMVGIAETANTRFTGSFALTAFSSDADNQTWAPTSGSFSGVMEDLTSEGSGQFLKGTLTYEISNAASYHAKLPETEANYVKGNIQFIGSITGSGRPEMKLTFGITRNGLNTFALSANYSYGTISVTGVGAVNKSNIASNVMTFTNQDGITLSFSEAGLDGVIKKGSTTLGTVPYGSGMVYYSDGYFESL